MLMVSNLMADTLEEFQLLDGKCSLEEYRAGLTNHLLGDVGEG